MRDLAMTRIGVYIAINVSQTVQSGQRLHRQGVDLPVGEWCAGERDGFGDALGFSAHGWREVDASGVFYEDVEAGGGGGGVWGGGVAVGAGQCGRTGVAW